MERQYLYIFVEGDHIMPTEFEFMHNGEYSQHDGSITKRLKQYHGVDNVVVFNSYKHTIFDSFNLRYMCINGWGKEPVEAIVKYLRLIKKWED